MPQKVSCHQREKKKKILAAAGSSRGRSDRENDLPCPMILYSHSSLWNHCIMGLRRHLPPSQTGDPDPVGEKLRHKCNNQTRIATKLGLSLCTVTNVHRHHRLELFCPFEEMIFRFICLFFFSPSFSLRSKPNMLLISCMLYV